MTADFSQYNSGSIEDPEKFVLDVPLGASSARVMMPRNDAEELMAQMVFILGYKIDLEGP